MRLNAHTGLLIKADEDKLAAYNMMPREDKAK